MSNISKEILRNYVNEQKFKNADEVSAAIKEMFKDVLQESLESEMAIYATGMTTRDISEQVKKLYGVNLSSEMVSNITNRILPVVTEWQNRPLEKTYSFVFMDAIHYKVREYKQIVVKSAYVVLGVNKENNYSSNNNLPAITNNDVVNSLTEDDKSLSFTF